MATHRTAVWQHGTVVEATDIADGIRRIVVEPDQPRHAEPGSHIDVTLEIGKETILRSYSVVESLDRGRRLALSVFRAPASRGGSIHMHTLGEGDRISMTQPLQNFPLRIGAPSYVLLAGGIGVTALVAMARALKKVKADYRIVYAGRSRNAMAYLELLQAEHGERLQVHVDDEGSTLDVPDLVAGLEQDTELYMCGPIRLMDAVRRAWQDHGLDEPNLRFETFGNSGWHDPEEFTVTIPALDVSATVGKGRSMLEALEDAGVEMMFDCRKGECGLCQVSILGVEGKIDHRDVFYSERQKNAVSRMCVCVSRVATSRSAEEVGHSAGVRPAVAIDLA